MKQEKAINPKDSRIPFEVLDVLTTPRNKCIAWICEEAGASFHLYDVEYINKRHPDQLKIPDIGVRNAVTPGLCIKVLADWGDQDGLDGCFWVRITEVTDLDGEKVFYGKSSTETTRTPINAVLGPILLCNICEVDVEEFGQENLQADLEYGAPSVNPNSDILAGKKKQVCAIDLTTFDISTVIVTSIEDIDEVKRQYEVFPDSDWCQGRGKKHLFKMLKKKLKKQDGYFNQNPAEVTALNQEWNDFCEDCLLLYVLDVHLNNKPFALIHPDTFVEKKKDAVFDATSGVVPQLIPGIPVLY